ncbi:MAG: T9SS type A sorting domain-containing protein, partial [Bacteroidota bacterium]
AFAPAPNSMWTEGWTNWDPVNTNYPAPTVTISGNITSNTTWTSSNTYLISGLVYVAAGVTLTIEPGTVIRGDNSVSSSSLIITKNAKLIAEGTLSNPIVFTSSKAVGTRAVGDWGGLIILGRATLNRPGGTANIEGIATSVNTEYGGGANPNDDDNSGVLKYVRIEFGGFVFNTDQEINGLTLGAVGRATQVDYVQVSYTNDDAFEWFGGTVNCSHLVAYRNLDDDFDTDFGYSGSVQFGLSVRDPLLSDQSSGSTSEGFESDTDGTAGTSTPATTCLFSNITVVGPFRGEILSSWPSSYKFRRAARIRRGTQLKLFNSILTDFPYGVHIDGTIVRANLQTGLTKFKNNLVAGMLRTTEPGTTNAVRDSIFGSTTGLFKNDSLATTANVLVNPYDYLNPDYRPGSQPLASTGASFNDEAFNGLITSCPEPAAPGAISGPKNIYLCDTAIAHTYTVPLSASATSFIWSVPAGARIISGQGTRTIVVKYASTFTTSATGGTISVIGKNDCGSTGAATSYTVVKIKPGTPAAISGIASNCSVIGSTATYTIAPVLHAESYTWAVPATGASIVSGQGTTSIVVAFTTAYTTGNISVKANSTCFTAGSLRTLAVTKRLPGTPGAMTGATDICPSFGSQSADSSNAVQYRINRVTGADSYSWTAPAGASIVSGQGDTSVLIKFARTFTSGAVIVKAVAVCGESANRSLTVFRRIAALPGAIQKSFVPSVVAQTAVCGKASETYMIRKVKYATSYSWTLKNGTNASITSVNGAGDNDTAVVVTFAPGFTTDSLIVRANTACSQSLDRRIFLTALSVTPAVTSITSSTGNFAPCAGATGITYTATALAPTSAQSPINVFRWTLPAGVARVSANSDSSEITVDYLSTYKGGAIAARGQSACGILGTAKSITLQYLPPTPVSITGSTTAPCVGNVITYTANVNPPTATQATAVRYRWTRPKNTTVVGATSDSSSIDVSFNTGYTGGSITVKGETACGVFGGVRSLTLTLCPPPAARGFNSNVNTFENNSTVVDQIYPNPNNGNFKLTVNTGIMENVNATVRVVDIYGRLISQFNAPNTNGLIITDYKGSNLANGVYTVQYTVGSVSKSMKFVVQK